MKAEDRSPLRIAVDYVWADRRDAQVVISILRKLGMQVSTRTENKKRRQDLISSLQELVADNDHVMVLLSADYLAVPFSRSEWMTFIVAGTPLIPVQLGQVDLDQFIASVARVELFRHSKDEWPVLIARCLGLNSSQPNTTFPGTGTFKMVSEMSPPTLNNLKGDLRGEIAADDEILRNLHASLATPANRRQTAIHALVGSAGSGKTVLANSYARRHLDYFDVVWWLRAQSRLSLDGDLRGLGVALGVSVESDDSDTIARSIRDWAMATDKRWLLVFDDVGDADGVLQLIPQVNRGQVLLTTRDADLPFEVQHTNIGVLDRLDAERYLLFRSGRNEPARARQLAVRLEGHTYALRLTTSWVKATGSTLSDYLEAIDAVYSRVPDEIRNESQRTLAAAIELALMEVTSRSKSARRLLATVALLDGEGVSIQLLSQLVRLRPKGLSEGLSVAVQFGMLTLSDSMIVSTHPAVSDYIVGRQPRSKVSQRILRCLKWFDEEIPASPKGLSDWEEVGEYLPHCIHLLRLAASHKVAGPEVTRLAHRCGQYAHLRGDQDLALDLYDLGLRKSPNVDSKDLPLEIQLIMNDAAVSQAESGRKSTAVSMWEDLIWQGRLSPAIEGMSDARPGGEVTSPHWDFGAALWNNLATGLADFGRVDDARNAMHRAADLANQDTYWGALFRLSVSHNYASLLADEGRVSEARARLEGVLAERRAALGDLHPTTVGSIIALAVCEARLGEAARARVDLSRQLEEASQRYGPSHPLVISTLDGLLFACYLDRDYESAVEYGLRALRIRQTTSGLRDDVAIDACFNLSRTFAALGREGQAVELLQYVRENATPTWRRDPGWANVLDQEIEDLVGKIRDKRSGPSGGYGAEPRAVSARRDRLSPS